MSFTDDLFEALRSVKRDFFREREYDRDGNAEQARQTPAEQPPAQVPAEAVAPQPPAQPAAAARAAGAPRRTR